MTIAKGSEAQLFGHGGFQLRPAAVPSRGSSELSVWTIEVAPEEKSPPRSVSREEVFVVVKGNSRSRSPAKIFEPARATLSLQNLIPFSTCRTRLRKLYGQCALPAPE